MDPKEFIAGLIKAGTAATGFLPGVRLPAIALRTALGASGDALAASAEGEDPLQAAMRGGAMNMVGEGMAKAIPAVSTRAALATGSKLEGLRNLNPAAKAYNREAERRMVPITVGETKRVKAGKGAAAAELEAAETSNPARIPFKNLEGSNDDLARRTINSDTPRTDRMAVQGSEAKFRREQLLERNGISDQDFRTMSVQLQQHMNIPLKDAQEMILSHLSDNTDLSVRQLGEAMRGIRNKGQSVVDARQKGAFVPSTELTKQQASANRSGRMRDEYRAVDTDTRTPMQRLRTDVDNSGRLGLGSTGDMQRANNRFSDLAQMEEASEQIRHDLGFTAVRGALGEGAGYMLGLPGGLGSVLGWSATPQNISGLGFLLSKLSRFAPSTVRSSQAAQDFQEGSGVKRRKPQ
jgi:hypothetical protein